MASTVPVIFFHSHHPLPNYARWSIEAASRAYGDVRLLVEQRFLRETQRQVAPYLMESSQVYALEEFTSKDILELATLFHPKDLLNPLFFELLCIERWFYIRNLCNYILRDAALVFCLDLDVITSMPLCEILLKLTMKDPAWQIASSPSAWSAVAIRNPAEELKDFCQIILSGLRSSRIYHNDMEFVAQFTEAHKHFLRTNKPFYDCVWDDTIWAPKEDYEKITVENKDMKKIYWHENHPYFCLKKSLGMLARCAFLHFQGIEYKELMTPVSKRLLGYSDIPHDYKRSESHSLVE
jgi:hypothetical protein